MKVILNRFFLLTLFASFSFFNGCDELTNLPINVPMVFPISTSGTNTTLTESASACLSQFDDWQQYQEDIQSATFVSAAYWTESASSGLTGNVNVTVSDNLGNVLFSVSIPNYAASSNIDQPYTLELTENEIIAFNDYLSQVGDSGDRCFNASLTISNITGNSTPYSLTGRVEVVVEADVEL
ncbi:MAG: hypothetical protein H6612_09455 [Ignavibacteriales bacterium]|nr:hypothetical protein [Ignavibacteriales bacterium]